MAGASRLVSCESISSAKVVQKKETRKKGSHIRKHSEESSERIAVLCHFSAERFGNF